MEFGWQTEWLCQICHPSRAGKAGIRLGAGDCGGKFGITALVATKKWNSGGKRSGCAKFATKVELEKLVVAWRLVIAVANLRLLL